MAPISMISLELVLAGTSTFLAHYRALRLSALFTNRFYALTFSPRLDISLSELDSSYTVEQFAKMMPLEQSLSTDLDAQPSFAEPEYTFPCVTCGKVYKYQTNLMRHRANECGQIPRHRCPLCPYKAKHRYHLKSHMNIKHPSYPFSYESIDKEGELSETRRESPTSVSRCEKGENFEAGGWRSNPENI